MTRVFEGLVGNRIVCSLHTLPSLLMGEMRWRRAVLSSGRLESAKKIPTLVAQNATRMGHPHPARIITDWKRGAYSLLRKKK